MKRGSVWQSCSARQKGNEVWIQGERGGGKRGKKGGPDGFMGKMVYCEKKRGGGVSTNGKRIFPAFVFWGREEESE